MGQYAVDKGNQFQGHFNVWYFESQQIESLVFTLKYKLYLEERLRDKPNNVWGYSIA